MSCRLAKPGVPQLLRGKTRIPFDVGLPLYNTLGEKTKKCIKKHKKVALLLGSIPVTVPLFYFADVWVLGSAAAAVSDIQSWWSGVNIFSTSEQKAAAAEYVNLWPWYLSHPFQAGRAWLTRPSETLTYPGIKHIWQWLNALLAVGSITGYLGWRITGRQNKENSSTRVHGLKVVNNPAYGTSRWAGLKDLVNFCELGPPVPLEKNAGNRVRFPGGNLIGELDGKNIRVNFEKMPDDTPKTAPHMLVFGGTGSGKSFSIVIGNIIAAVSEGQSIVVIDPKGELFSTTGNWLKQQGYENVWVLNFMQPEHSHRWDPVIECLDDAEISEMIDTLSKNASSGSDSYFMLKAMELMESMIGLLKGDFPVEQQHMRSIMTLAAWPEEKLDERFREAYKSGKISPTIYERWRGVVKKNYEYAVSNLTAVLKNLTTASLAAMMSEQEIDLNQIGQKKTALFLIIPTGGEGVYLKPILSIFYKFLFKRLDKLAFKSPGQKLPVKVRNIWDEMANVGMIPGLPEIISTARSKGIHIQMILQTIKQLESVYGVNEASTILGNCPTVMLIGIAPADRDLARMFSELLGTAAVEAKKVSEDLTVPGKHLFELKKKTRTVIERPLMSTDEVMRIGPKDSVAILQWFRPLYLRKVGWIKLPQAKEIKNCGMLPVEQMIPARSFEISLPEIETDMETHKDPESALWMQLKRRSMVENEDNQPATELGLLKNNIHENQKHGGNTPKQPQSPDLTNDNGYKMNSYNQLNPANDYLGEIEPQKNHEATEELEPTQNNENVAENVDAQGFNVKSPLF